MDQKVHIGIGALSQELETCVEHGEAICDELLREQYRLGIKTTSKPIDYGFVWAVHRLFSIWQDRNTDFTAPVFQPSHSSDGHLRDTGKNDSTNRGGDFLGFLTDVFEAAGLSKWHPSNGTIDKAVVYARNTRGQFKELQSQIGAFERACTEIIWARGAVAGNKEGRLSISLKELHEAYVEWCGRERISAIPLDHYKVLTNIPLETRGRNVFALNVRLKPKHEWLSRDELLA